MGSIGREWHTRGLNGAGGLKLKFADSGRLQLSSILLPFPADLWPILPVLKASVTSSII